MQDSPLVLQAEAGIQSWRGRWTRASFAEDGPQVSQCLLCPHGCELREGEIGLCAVRRRKHGRMETAGFSTIAQHWGTVERKPLYHYRPGMKVLTLAPPGCTMGCLYCQNHPVSQVGRTRTAVTDAAEVDVRALSVQAEAAGAAIALSYTEPALGAELTLALAASGDAPIIWKTNGFLTKIATEAVAVAISAANIDLKCATERAHLRLTGASLRPVLDTIAAFRAAGIWVELSTPIIPGFNDDRKSVSAMAAVIAQIDPKMPWHLLRVTPEYRLHAIAPTLPAVLQRALETAKDAGLAYVYVERALGMEGRETRCATCGLCVIRRGIWETAGIELQNGACPKCKTRIPGVWSRS